MPHLFSPLRIGRLRVPNRVAMAPMISGLASTDGFIGDAVLNYYAECTRSGIGLVMTEPLQVMRLVDHEMLAHIGIYHDAFIPGLRTLTDNVHATGGSIIALIDAPATLGTQNERILDTMGMQFLQAAWRTLAAGFDGVCLSIADHGALHTLASPIYNHRHDRFANNVEGRNSLLLAIIKAIHTHLGERLTICLRMIADEFTPGGIGLPDARLIARRAASAGVQLIDVTTDHRLSATVARFPAWAIPLASAIRRVNPGIPVIGSGILDDPHIADGIIRDGSVDMIMLDTELRANPNWIAHAHEQVGATNSDE